MSYNLDKKIERELISSAKHFGLRKLILFGSRARGNNHERSDIDLAAQGGDISEFAAAVEEQVETLLSFDIINLDDDLAEDFKAEIERDGIILYEEIPVAVKKFDAFNKSLAVLLRSNREINDEIYRMGIIGQFHLTFELSWKALREVLLIHGVSEAISGSPREIIKAGYKFNFISDENIWLDMLKRRNQTIHVYDEGIALELIDLIFDKYFAAFVNLREELNRRQQFS
jgi:nucleotidyltransferase substrate binding protein (TIGR01987 family)